MSDREATSTPHKRCLECAYILDYLPEHCCPECGRAFDPEDPLTFTGGDPSLALARSGKSLLIWACVGTSLFLFAVICFIGVALGGPTAGEHPVAMLASCGLLVGFVIQIVVALRVSRSHRRGLRSPSHTAAGWIAVGPFAVMILLGILGALIDWMANL